MKMLIDGELVSSDKKFRVENPYTQEIIGLAPIASNEQIKKAIEGSYNRENNLNGEQRSQILIRIANQLREQKESFAQLITAELGISLKNSRYELDRAATVFDESARVAKFLDKIDHNLPFLGDPNHEKAKKAKMNVLKEPLKLVIGITPFNHPLNQIAHKIAPAIASGSSIVLKPSEKTPLTALKFAAMIQDIVPANMVNIITGNPPKQIVDQLVTHPLVELVSFTGGSFAGKSIMRKMAESNKELTKKIMELGGNASLTVLEDADIELATDIALGAFDNSGQRCTAIKRIMLHNDIAQEFLTKFVEKTKLIKCGNPTDPDTDMGTVVNKFSAMEIERRVQEAILDGANLLLGNKRDGALYPPTILDNVSIDSEIVVQETFGPVAPIVRIINVDDAIEKINLSKFKLAGAIVTKDKNKALYLANKIRVGQFSWNGKPGFRTEQAPFGGFGDSGNYEKEGVVAAVEGMFLTRTFYEHNIIEKIRNKNIESNQDNILKTSANFNNHEINLSIDAKSSLNESSKKKNGHLEAVESESCKNFDNQKPDPSGHQVDNSQNEGMKSVRPKKAIILAAGKSSRLYPLTLDKPKCLLDIGGKSIIEHQVKLLEECGIKDIVVGVGYLQDKIRSHLGNRVRYREINGFNTTNNLYSLWEIKDELNDDCLILFADVVFGKNILDKCMNDINDFSLLVHNKSILADTMRIYLEDNNIKKIGSHVSVEEGHGNFIGIAKYSKKAANILAQEVNYLVNKNQHQNDYYTLALENLAAKGQKIAPIMINDAHWAEIDNKEDYQRVLSEIAPNI